MSKNLLNKSTAETNKVEKRKKSPPVTFHPMSWGLSIHVDMSKAQAEAIKGQADKHAHAKWRASQSILGALEKLGAIDRRDSEVFIQGHVPSNLKARLKEAARVDRKTMTRLIRANLYSWLSERTGGRRFQIRKDGTKKVFGPDNLRKYAAKGLTAYQQAAENSSLKRLEVQVGPKVAAYLRTQLAPSFTPMGHFLTAVILDILADE